jgi:plasmid maintenance system antidote protein VapI
VIAISNSSMYNDVRNSQEVETMFLLESKENIGKYLKKLIKERGFEKDADFSRAYLKEKYRNIDYTEDDLNEQLKTTKSTFSQIFSGNKGITIEHLAIISKLLCVSCEEILSAGKQYASTRNHVTNYEIAQSHDRKVWDEYMKREDKLFLNCDEYRKTVIDYALEFKNYSFMKYLLEENFIWFVDNSKENYELYYYGADTSIKSNWDRFDMPDQFMHRKLYEEDKLRTQTAVLAIENGDCDVLDNLHAREIPELHDITIWGTDNLDFVKNRNDDLIEAIAASENEEILAYFSDEFPVQDRWKRENSLMFPFLNDVIKIMLDNNNNKCAEFIIRKMIAHNKSTYEKTYSLIKEACQAEYNAIQKNKEKIIKEAYQNGISLADLKVSGYEGHHEKVDRSPSGLEPHLRSACDILWRQDTRITFSS